MTAKIAVPGWVLNETLLKFPGVSPYVVGFGKYIGDLVTSLDHALDPYNDRYFIVIVRSTDDYFADYAEVVLVYVPEEYYINDVIGHMYMLLQK